MHNLPNASAIIVTSTVLGFFLNRWWLVLVCAAGALMLQHALQGRCPVLHIHRRMGIRTVSEINQEKTALRYIIGDFETLGNNPEEIGKRADKKAH